MALLITPDVTQAIGTANQITVSPASGNGAVTFSLPQNIATGSSPTFTGLTLSSFTLGSVIFAGTGGLLSQNNSKFFWDNTNNVLGIGTASPTAGITLTTGTNTKLIAITAPAFSTAASTEFTPITIDLSATHTFATGPFSSQRAIRILSPTYAMSSTDNLNTAATVSIEGPPNAGSMNLTNSYGLWIPTRAVNFIIQYAIGAVIEAPTGAFGSNIALVANGKLGVGTLTPQSQFDVQGAIFDTSMNHVCIDGITRYSFGYFGGTAYTSIPSGGSRGMVYDYGFSPSSNSTFATGTLQSLFTFGGTFNNTGTMVNAVFNTTLNGSGTVTAINSSNASIITSASTSNTITAARSYLSSNNIGGTGTITDYIGYDQSFTLQNVAGTITNTYGLRIGNPSRGAAYTLTNFYGVDIEDNTATFGGVKIGFYQKGTNLENRFVSNNNSFGQDATAGATIDVAGKLFIAGASGAITKYNNQTTTGTGTSYLLQSPAISATKTANFTVFSYTPTASAAVYQVCGVISTTSATNTGTVQFTLDYKDSNGTTHTADIIPLIDAAGASATTKTGASKEFHTPQWLFTVDNSATAIALKVVITGTVSYTVTGTIERVV